MWVANKKNEKYIKKIQRKVAQIINEVGDAVDKDYAKENEELLQAIVKVKGKNIKYIQYLPDSFDIARYYDIKIEYVKLEGEIPSYLKREKKKTIIFISDKYRNDSYRSKKFVAHELGHFFLDSTSLAAFNNDFLNMILPREKMREYAANIFAVTLMPQIMAGEQWEKCSPDVLNRKVYKKLLDK